MSSRVAGLLVAFDVFLALLRVVLFWVALVLAVVFAVDWLVRTRRIGPFHPVARFVRRAVDPLVAPVERRVVRAGGLPSSAPWWALVAVVIGGILLIVLLGFVRDQLALLAFAAGAGPAGLYRVLVSWTIGVLQIALLVRVVASWVRISEYSPWVSWSVVLTEPILRPLRSVIPPLGMLDIVPLVAWFLLGILRMLLLRL